MERESQLRIKDAERINRNVRGTLDQKTVLRGLRNRFWPRARSCYNAALTRHHDQSGAVDIELYVGKGELSLAAVHPKALKHPDPRLLSCLQKAAWRVEFPAGLEDPVIYRIVYPLRLRPPQGKQPARLQSDDIQRFEWLLAQPLPKE